MKKCSILTLATFTGLMLAQFPGGVNGQTVEAARGAINQTGTRTRLGGISPETAGALGAGEYVPKMEGDEEFGVQRILYRRSNWEPFTVRFDFSGSYTSNVALVNRGVRDDYFLRSGLQFNYTPQLKGGWFFTTTLSDQIYRYADASFFDFDLLQADAGFIYATPQQGTIYDPIFGDLTSYVRYGYYRIAEPWDWGENVFDNHSILTGVQKLWRISRGHQAYLGLASDWSFEASEDVPQRDEHSIYVGYRIRWTNELESNIQYRAAWYDYHSFGRDDFNQIVSLGLEYRFTDWFRAGAYVSGTFNNSDFKAFDYDVFNTGVGLAIVINW
jgi:hypothetical protein